MKKILSIIWDCLVWLLVIFAACMTVFTVVSLRTVDAQHRSIFGYKAFIVQSDSMAATDFDAGDVIFVKEVDPSTLREGDIIAYISRSPHNSGNTVTHKIRSLVQNESGDPGFVTYGTTTGADDEQIVTYSDVLGKYTGRVEDIGVFFVFMRTPKGYVSIILIPFILLILYSLFNCLRLFGQARKEHEEAREAVLLEEQQKNEDMRQELSELKAMVAALAAGKTVEPVKEAVEAPSAQSTEKEPASQLLPVPEPVKAAEPVTEPETVQIPQPVILPEPEKKAESVKIPEPVEPAQAVKKVQSVKADEPVKLPQIPPVKAAPTVQKQTPIVQPASRKQEPVKPAAPKAPAQPKPGVVLPTQIPPVKPEFNLELHFGKNAGQPSAGKTTGKAQNAPKAAQSKAPVKQTPKPAPTPRQPPVAASAPKPSRPRKGDPDYDELDLENIVAEFSPSRTNRG